jgi:hypothetical protein
MMSKTHDPRMSSALLRGAVSLSLMALCLLVPNLWPTLAWSQQPVVNDPPTSTQVQFQKRVRARVVAEPQLPASNSSSALASALSVCDKAADVSDALVLPGAKGEIKLDRCYRGRDHLVCGMTALHKEAKSLMDDYAKIVDVGYPDISNVEGLCAIKSENLATDLQNANEFSSRFRLLKAEYGARTSCAGRIGQSFRDVTLPDMVQAPEVLKSMIGSIEGDSKDLSILQAQVVDFAGRIDSSQKAMITIRKIHQTMCFKRAEVDGGKP